MPGTSLVPQDRRCGRWHHADCPCHGPAVLQSLCRAGGPIPPVPHRAQRLETQQEIWSRVLGSVRHHCGYRVLV